MALVACQGLSVDSDRFWPAAFGIMERYPDSQAVKSQLASRVENLQGGWVGPYSSNLDRCLAEVNRARERQDVSQVARQWLDDLARSFELAVGTEERRETEEEVNP